MEIKPPQSRGELIALITLLAAFVGYAITQHERIRSAETALADRPVLMERRDRETDAMRQEIQQIRDKLLCPCHDR